MYSDVNDADRRQAYVATPVEEDDDAEPKGRRIDNKMELEIVQAADVIVAEDDRGRDTGDECPPAAKPTARSSSSSTVLAKPKGRPKKVDPKKEDDEKTIVKCEECVNTTTKGSNAYFHIVSCKG